MIDDHSVVALELLISLCGTTSTLFAEATLQGYMCMTPHKIITVLCDHGVSPPLVATIGHTHTLIYSL